MISPDKRPGVGRKRIATCFGIVRDSVVRTLSRFLGRAGRDLSATIVTRLGEGAIARHDSLDHRHDELRGIGSRLARRPAEHSSISDEIAMHGGGQFDADFVRLVVVARPVLELRYGMPP